MLPVAGNQIYKNKECSASVKISVFTSVKASKGQARNTCIHVPSHYKWVILPGWCWVGCCCPTVSWPQPGYSCGQCSAAHSHPAPPTCHSHSTSAAIDSRAGHSRQLFNIATSGIATNRQIYINKSVSRVPTAAAHRPHAQTTHICQFSSTAVAKNT